MQVPVWVEGWQLQCCGEPFEVGSMVSWRLTADSDDFVVTALGGQAPAWSAALPLLEPAVGSAVSGVAVGGEGLRVFIDRHLDPRPVPPAGITLHMLVEDHHVGVPEDFAPIHGRVAAIQLARFARERDPAHGAIRPRAGGAMLTAVSRAERWPVDEVDGRSFAGYLVTLDVAPAG